MTILIVDDSALIVTKIKELLQDVVCEADCNCCGTYTDAVEFINRYKPKIVLLDINLPGKSGIDLLRYIKNDCPATIVIMVTNQTHDFYRTICLQLGATHYLDKSVDFEKLTDIVSSYC